MIKYICEECKDIEEALEDAELFCRRCGTKYSILEKWMKKRK